MTALAVCTGKPGSVPHDPKSYRVLAVLATLYRTWAKARLRDVSPWAQQWLDRDAFAGLWGGGAELA
eukprot:33837-Alexandrium_andersonii.AAC.1